MTSTSRRSWATWRGNGYDGWYVLEQDTILQTDPSGEGPVATSGRAWSTCAGCSPRPAYAVRNHCGSASSAPPGSPSSRHRARADHGCPAGRGRRARPDPRRGVRVAARRRARRRVVRRAGRRSRGRGRLQPAGERAARAVEPRRRRGGQARPHREAVGEQRGRGPARRRGRGPQGDADGGVPLPLPPAARAACTSCYGRPIGELRHVEIHMVMPAPDDGDPRWRRDRRRRADGRRLLRPARVADARPPVDHPRARRRTHVQGRRMVRCGARLPRRRNGAERQHDDRLPLLVHSAHRRHQGRPVGAQLHQAERGRPADHTDTRRHAGGTPRHQDVVHLPAGVIRRPRAPRRSAAHRAPLTPWRTWPLSTPPTAFNIPVGWRCTHPAEYIGGIGYPGNEFPFN